MVAIAFVSSILAALLATHLTVAGTVSNPCYTSLTFKPRPRNKSRHASSLSETYTGTIQALYRFLRTLDSSTRMLIGRLVLQFSSKWYILPSHSQLISRVILPTEDLTNTKSFVSSINYPLKQSDRGASSK